MTRPQEDTAKAQDFALTGIQAIGLLVNRGPRSIEWEIGMLMTLSLVRQAPEIVGPFAALLDGVDDDHKATKDRALKIMQVAVEACQIPPSPERNNI